MPSEKSSSDNKHELYASLALFQRVLFHKIRTPLSVIVNELECLSSLVDHAETELAKKKCRELTELLKNISNSFNADPAQCACTELVGEDYQVLPHADPVLVPQKIFQEIFTRLAVLARQTKTNLPLQLEIRKETLTIKQFFPSTGKTISLCCHVLESCPQLDSIEPSIISALAVHAGYDCQINEAGDLLFLAASF